MNDKAKLELLTLGTAATLGILGDVLLRCFPWGINFAIWGVSLALALFFLGPSTRPDLTRGAAWVLLPVMLAPVAFVWHESPVLKALDVFSLLVALSLAMLCAQGVQLRASSLARYALGSIIAGLNTAFGIFPLLFGNAEWKKPVEGKPRRGAAVLRGAAFSLLPMLVFGSLLMAADAVFQNLIHRLLCFDFTHLVVFAFIAICVGGYLRGFLFGKELNADTLSQHLSFSLGAIETGIMLGLLDLLFLAFVIVQIRYFFGGSATVHAITGLTYSEYARRGFFELLTVAMLLLPFLLIVHWLLRTDDVRGQRLFQWFAGLQITLLFVIMASAVQRMRLYETEYGLSRQRLYPTAFMGWLAVVFVWFCLTVIRGHRERFAFGAMVAGFLLVVALHVINPDALIARTNMQRERAGQRFDVSYLENLSADAVPDIVEGLPTLHPWARRILSKQMLDQWSRPQSPDWRSWSIARAQAWQSVSENESTLRAATIQPRR